MPVLAITQALISRTEAAAYLRDQGMPVDSHDMLQRHINSVSAFIARFTGRSHLHYSATAIVEYRDGTGDRSIHTVEAPIRSLDEIVLLPHYASGLTTITGPGTSPSNDDVLYESKSGLVVLQDYAFPDSLQSVRITYKAGYYQDGEPTANDPADPEMALLQMIAMDAVARRWRRFLDKTAGVASRSREGQTTVYRSDDFDKGTLRELSLFRRSLFA